MLATRAFLVPFPYFIFITPATPKTTMTTEEGKEGDLAAYGVVGHDGDATR